MTLTCTIPGPPQPKERARRGRGGRWYTPPRTRRYEAYVSTCLFAARFEYDARAYYDPVAPWPRRARYALHARVFFGDRRRRDSDNVLKSIQDAGHGVLWDDDSQITCVTITRDVDREHPRVELVVEVLP